MALKDEIEQARAKQDRDRLARENKHATQLLYDLLEAIDAVPAVEGVPALDALKNTARTGRAALLAFYAK